jgi:tRNA(His) guanylyltransferase
MADNDSLGDRMKLYEGMEAERRLLPLLPVMVRIDGRAFSSFTRGLNRPYDERMSRLMVETTKALVEESHALIGYTQSDEISLVLFAEESTSQLMFNARTQKLASILGSLATAVFNAELMKSEIADYARKRPIFDCRVWNVPNKDEAANCILWRERDATKNSLQMAAQSVFSHKQLQGKSGSDLHEMLFQKGINWDKYPAFFKRGTFVRRVTVERPFTADELEALPPMHEARLNPGLMVTRSQVVEIDMPPFGRVRNRAAVIFDKADPVIGEEDTPVPPMEDISALESENANLRYLLKEAVRGYQGIGVANEAWLDEAIQIVGDVTSNGDK